MIEPITSTTGTISTYEKSDRAAGAAAGTHRLLQSLTAAGPFFALVAVIQIFTRPGFDLGHQALSLLTLGTLGWVQSANFILTGLMIVVGAAGIRQVLRGGPGGRWLPILLTVCGIGLISAGLFHPDASSGFPPGTPAGGSAVSSWHGVLHMLSGSLSFVALIVACFVLGRKFARMGQRRWAAGSRLTGTLCAIGVVTAGMPGGTVSLFVGVSLALLWVSLAALQLSGSLSGPEIAQSIVGADLS